MNKIVKISNIAMVVIMLSMAALPMIALAQQGTIDVGLGPVQNAVGYTTRDLRAVIGDIIRAVLGFLGVVAIVIILIGGFKWMTAGGSDEKVGDAKKWLISGIIGLAIVLAAYAITTYVIGELMGAVTSDVPEQ